MLAQVGDNSSSGEDLLRERGERAESRVPGGSAEQPGGKIERHVVAIVRHRESVR